jgi:cell division transport system permease protein
MRLVGATNWYIRGPFLAEAIMYSLTAAIITSLLLVPVYGKVLPKIWQYIAPGQALGNFITYGALIAVLLVAALVLSVISTLLVIRRYLKI